MDTQDLQEAFYEAESNATETVCFKWPLILSAMLEVLQACDGSMTVEELREKLHEIDGPA